VAFSQLSSKLSIYLYVPFVISIDFGVRNDNFVSSQSSVAINLNSPEAGQMRETEAWGQRPGIFK
jgi:hypothetical protein